jgi:hypothetical protein
MRILITACALVFAVAGPAASQDRFVSKLTLPKGETVVVAEGDFEARSIGSFSIRLYQAAAAPDETTFFSSGLVRARDGAIEKLMLGNINADPQQEVIVTVRSAGTGSYLSAHAFAVAKDKLVFVAAVEDLAADADPLVALRKAARK